MIKTVTVTNYLGESLSMELANPRLSGIAVLGIEGLDPPKGIVNTSDYATGDGASFNSSRAQFRNVLLYFKPMGNDVAKSRRELYKYFPVKRQVTLTIEDTDRVVQAIGIVENNDVNIFSNNQISQISIICPDAYLRSPSQVSTVVSGVESLFEFPFGDETEFELAAYRKNNGANIHYDGDSEVGVTIKVHMSGIVRNLTIYNSATRQVLTLDTTKAPNGELESGDDLIISTVRGNKSVKLIRAGVTYNMISMLTRPIAWLNLIKGDNVFAYQAEFGETDLVMQIEHTILYEGI